MSSGGDAAAAAGEHSGWLWAALAALHGAALSCTRLLVTSAYDVYRHMTLMSLMINIIKYIPTGLFFYKALKNVYMSSRKRLLIKQSEIDDIQLQIKIVKTKIKVRESEFLERSVMARRRGEELCALRTRVRGLLMSDDSLRRLLKQSHMQLDEPTLSEEDLCKLGPGDEDHESIMTLLKELKATEYDGPETAEDMKAMQEDLPGERPPDDESVYTSVSDCEDKQDYRVKIVRITNVYRVACLKHYIKQKRLRRATQRAMLKKKIDSMRNLLESWHKSLNAVLYNKLYSKPLDMASQAMGDYSKPSLRDFSDSDSELKTSFDNSDDYWQQYGYSCDGEEVEARTIYEGEFGDAAVGCASGRGSGRGPGGLFVLPEETNSQVLIEEIGNEQA